MSIVGIANGLLESLPITKLLTRTPVGKQIKQRIVAEIGKRVVKQAVSESGTESLQQIVSNSVAKSYDQDRALWDQLPESAFFGGIMGGGSSIVFDTADVMRGKTQPTQQSKAEPQKTAVNQEADSETMRLQKQFEAKLAEANAREKEVRATAPSEIDTANQPANAVKQALDSETPVVGIMKPETAQFVQQGLSGLSTVEDILAGTTDDIIARIEQSKKILEQIAAQKDADDLAAATVTIKQDDENLMLAIGDAAVKKAQEAGIDLGEYQNPEKCQTIGARSLSRLSKNQYQREEPIPRQNRSVSLATRLKIGEQVSFPTSSKTMILTRAFYAVDRRGRSRDPKTKRKTGWSDKRKTYFDLGRGSDQQRNRSPNFRQKNREGIYYRQAR